jgi:hypothetical protein
MMRKGGRKVKKIIFLFTDSVLTLVGLICCFFPVSLTAQVYISDNVQVQLTIGEHTQFYTGEEVIKSGKVFVADKTTIVGGFSGEKKHIRSTRITKKERLIARNSKKRVRGKEKIVSKQISPRFTFHIIPQETSSFMVSISKRCLFSIPGVYVYKNIYAGGPLRNIIACFFSKEKKTTYTYVFYPLTENYWQVHGERGPPLNKHT